MSWPELLRQLVETRALGQCEYCLIHQTDAGLPHEIDHVISRKHGGDTEINNLAFSCYLCNRYKESDISSHDPETRASISPSKGPLGRALLLGAVTTRLLRSNIAARVIERQMLQSLGRYLISNSR